MYCQYCGNRLVINGKYCGRCGKAVSAVSELEPQLSQAIDIPKQEEWYKNLCEICGEPGELRRVIFYENRGALVVRFHREIRGNLCKDCVNKHFWKFTLITLCIGWLGAISLIIAPIYIINNVFWYIRAKII